MDSHPMTDLVPSAAAQLFSSELANLSALVLKRLQLECHYHQRPDLERADQQLLQHAMEFGRLLTVVYRHNLFPALREECAWHAAVLRARGSDHDALALLLDSWIMAIQGLLKPPECNELARPLQLIRDDLDKPAEPAPTQRVAPAKTANLELLERLVCGDVHGARDVLSGIAAGRLPPDRLIVDVMLPAMAEVGQRWQANELEVYQEHLATEAIRSLLAGLAGMRPESQQRTAALGLVSCAPGDAHELIPLALASYLTCRGWSARNLGVGLPAGQIARAVAAFHPQVLFLTFTMLSRFEDVLEVMAEVRRQPGHCPIIVGGRGAVATRHVLEGRGALVALDFDEGFRLAGEGRGHA